MFPSRPRFIIRIDFASSLVCAKVSLGITTDSDCSALSGLDGEAVKEETSEGRLGNFIAMDRISKEGRGDKAREGEKSAVNAGRKLCGG